MTFLVHSRSPLGQLRGLRAAVVMVPILSVLSLSVAGARYENGAVIDPENAAILQPFLVPLWAVTVFVVFAISKTLTPESPMPLRYAAICVAYILALLTSMISLMYSLAGPSSLWAIAGYAFAITTLGMVSLSRFASDVSPDPW